MKLPNFIVRVLAGAVYVGLLLVGILINQYVFLGVFSVLTFLTLFEFYGLVNDEVKAPVSKTVNSLAGVALFVGVFCYVSGLCSHLFAFVPYALFMLGVFISELYLKKEDPIKSLAYTTLGQMYIAIPFAMINLLVFSFIPQYNWIYILAILVFIWVNDSFAYLTGMTFGRNKMFERISPKKSWEGFVGGACFTIGASVAVSYFFETNLSLIEWIGFAMVVVVFGTLGDLIESLLKRTLKIKDSGNMIPGHGGILDRFDSTILAIPAVVCYLAIVSIF